MCDLQSNVLDNRFGRVDMKLGDFGEQRLFALTSRMAMTVCLA